MPLLDIVVPLVGLILFAVLAVVDVWRELFRDPFRSTPVDNEDLDA
jgi:hypothetical protein